ncbi:hypothetical protein PTKIN_Ptkin19aG0048800 [Pterospermum kingtungense]
MISIAQSEKAEVSILGNSKMAQDCIKAYDLSLDYLNKVASMVKTGNPKDVEEIKTVLKEVANAFESCDYEDVESTTSKKQSSKAKSDGAKAYGLSLDYLNKVVGMVKVRNPNDVKEIKTILKEVAKAFESSDYKDIESTTSKQRPLKAKSDGAKGITYLYLINWMISIAQSEKAKVSTLGNRNPNDVEEIKTILKEVANAFESCDYEYTESTTSKQRPSKTKPDGAKHPKSNGAKQANNN